MSPAWPSYGMLELKIVAFQYNFCSISIFNLLLKIEATCTIARVVKSGCNLIARKRLGFTKIIHALLDQEQTNIFTNHFKTSNSFACQIQKLEHFNT